MKTVTVKAHKRDGVTVCAHKRNIGGNRGNGKIKIRPKTPSPFSGRNLSSMQTIKKFAGYGY